jgi:hypothetical protein
VKQRTVERVAFALQLAEFENNSLS